MSASTGLSLTGFTAHDLPREKWFKLVDPKVRLRVRGKRCNFVSSDVKVDNWRPDAEQDRPCTYWSCNEPRDENFEIVVERRFLLRYKCIRRTKRVAIDQVRTDDDNSCTLLLYDGQHPAGGLEDKVDIGKITLTLS